MKCQRNASPYSACLRLQVLRPVLADDLDPGLGEHGHVRQVDVLRRDDDGDSRADLARTRSYAARTDSGDKRDHSLPAGEAAVAAVREEELRVAGGAEVDAARSARRPPRAAPARRRVQRSSLRPLHDVGAEALAVRRRPPPPPPRSSTGRSPGRSPRRLASAESGARPPRRSPRAARASLRAGPPRPGCLRSRARARAEGSRRRARAAAGRARRSRARRPARRAPGARAVHDASSASAGSSPAARRRAPTSAHEPAAVLLDALGVVVGQAAEVERRERPFADAADARREHDLYGPGGSQRITRSSSSRAARAARSRG